MNEVTNPYRPGAGTKPSFLAGRDEILQMAEVLLQRVKIGNPQRSLMLYGLRGVGKTVLLNAIKSKCIAIGYEVEQIEMSQTDDFKKVIANNVRKILLKISTLANFKDKAKRALGVLKAFTISIPDGPEFKLDVDAVIGEGDSGNFETDLSDLFINLGHAAKEVNKPVCILIDETQYLNQNAMAALIAACHKISQEELPVVVICAGLPSILALVSDAKSYAERLFEFLHISHLTTPDDALAITVPAKNEGVDFDGDAVSEIINTTKGYPYFLQEFGKHVWGYAKVSPITISDVVSAKSLFLKSLDKSFFKVRFDRATGREKLMMHAMSSLGSGPCLMADVAKKMKISTSSLSPTRATLINKGFIYPTEHGKLDFTVPLFNDFLKRVEE